ncbi:MAG: quinone-dependent dihydroorotate dehydrogenase [Hyphomicrobiales bacterium]
MTLAGLAFPLFRPVLHRMDAESAHDLTIRLLRQFGPGRLPPADPRLTVHVLGLDFPNPLGLAAGFDKNAEVADAMLGLGFGFAEIGTVTPRPQPGNPRPRLFRLPDDRGVINRMGFNNQGHAAVLHRLAQRQGRPGIVGVNIGANKDSEDRVADYAAGIVAFSDLAAYITVNISSPNTPGLRGLQSRAELESLLAGLGEARARQQRRPPMLLKIAPDLRDDELEDIARCCSGGAVDGIIVSNTTLGREGLTSAARGESGGLSGAPLLTLSTRVLAKMFLLTEGRLPLVGAGGIDGVETAWLKFRAGASLLQLYSALVYAGPGLVTDMLSRLSARLASEGLDLAALRGTGAADIAHQGLSGT